MAIRRWLGSLLSAFPRGRRCGPEAGGRARRGPWLSVEQLEDRCVPAVQGGPPVVFVGDSITALYQFSPSWVTNFAPLGATDLGVPGNTAEFLQAQINSGLLAGTSPRLVVLMIGINDLIGGESPQQTASGVAGCVAALRANQPQAQILLLGILPAGPLLGRELRPDIVTTNALLAGLDDHSAVHFVDIGSVFLQPDGSVSPVLLPDRLHPSAFGYALETAAIGQPVVALLTGARSVSAAFGPFGEVVEAVYRDGRLVQSDAFGQHLLGGGALTVSVGFGPVGEVLDVFFASGYFYHFDAFGAHLLANYPPVPGAFSGG